ncbi:RNA polymerase sigma factor [Streptomyces sp. NPDC007983]|uniref:RNA polymerase sigma factor n=1 Tax=Streptomyces sp. NPDC007983 TaxID=3364800 RepID=UPI0036E04182
MSEAEPGMDFEAFVLETSAIFFRAARAEADDLHSAEDAVQAVYLKMFQSWTKLSARQGSLIAYGRTAVKNAVIDQFRKNRRLITAPHQELPEQPSAFGIPDAAYEIVKEGIDELISKLPDRQRQVIVLCILQDLSPAYAGERLGLKEESVKRYIHAATKNLQKAIIELREEVTA